MIIDFKNQGTEDIFEGQDSKLARKTCPNHLWKVARRKLDQIDSVLDLTELKIPPGNRLESLSGDRQGQFSIRINEQYRICFSWTSMGATNIEITDYHN